MDFDWMKIGQAALLVLFIVVLWPAVRWWSQNSPKAESGDWPAALIAIAAVALLVAFLVMMVR